MPHIADAGTVVNVFIAILIAASVIPLIIDTGKVLALDITHRSDDIERALREASYVFTRTWSIV